ncbi:MAG: hypothetical protein PHV06_12050 [bacterium]|nr:hypothetical protein [bacterium]
MKKGICPKCGAETVYSKNDGIKYSVMQGVVIVKTNTILNIPSSAISYVCTTCGYFENYITDKNKLSAVAKEWKKVG